MSEDTPLKRVFENIHSGDKKQLDAVFSSSRRLIVEAPAGYGKTNTLISRIAYLLSSNQIPVPKKILVLTFSVNAAYKIKKDVAGKLPVLLPNKKININDRIIVSNYHGFCRRILRRHGYLLNPILLNIDKLTTFDDSREEGIPNTVDLLYDEKVLMSKFNDNLKILNYNYIKENLDNYNAVIINKLLPYGLVSYNAILTLTLKLLTMYANIRGFYQKMFAGILIDEFQDTNYLSYLLTYTLIKTSDAHVTLFGDSLQRIYGFIGAIPNLIHHAATQLDANIVTLNSNYRFKDNDKMLLLEYNIRRIAEKPQCPEVLSDVQINFDLHKDQDEEAFNIAEKIKKLRYQDPTASIAVLVTMRGRNIDKIISTLDNKNVDYFYALFSDEDPLYIAFHRFCLSSFYDGIKEHKAVTKRLMNHVLSSAKKEYKDTDQVRNALINLLSIMIKQLFSEYAALSDEDKFSFVVDTFEGNSLKHFIEFVDSNVIVATVHGAKGLEWDYVILPDMESDSFPTHFGLCNDCRCRSNCKIVITDTNVNKFLEALSVFYVAVTRAKKDVFFLASSQALTNSGVRNRNVSCFLRLTGISI